MTQVSKVCPRCQERKPIEGFYLCGGKRQRRYSHCKACCLRYNHERWNRDPEKAREQTRQWRRDNPQKWLVSQARSRAKRLGLPFNLEPGDLIIPERCPVLGLKLETVRGHGPANSSPSVDRVIPDRGYVKGNVHVISFQANRLKSDASAEDLERLLLYIRQHDDPGVVY